MLFDVRHVALKLIIQQELWYMVKWYPELNKKSLPVTYQLLRWLRCTSFELPAMMADGGL